MRCHALRALTIGLVLALAAAAPAAEPVPLGPCGPIDRPYDSVELTGSQLHRLGNVPIARLGLLAFRGPHAAPIPFQVDERTGRKLALPDGPEPTRDDPPDVLDADDLLVFMGCDAGERGSAAALEETLGVTGSLTAWREIRIEDPVRHAAGFVYRSDTRGTYPYRPAAEGRVFRIPEIPTTLPTLDELYGRVARRPQALAEYILQGLRPGQLNVHTLHAELEGGPHLDVLEALLAGVQGVARVVRLCDEATALAPATLPVCSVREGAVPGRAMPVALQGPSVSAGT